ncbi:PilZ domain-containing protein [Vallicoccus soli]|uniref:PilZ domain-containing protein n=1 Tax=Vallicoccus soli TaxID=2339232 RepID=A0A3A3YQN1_9ACTN|nr:PilZ domain-containing protein [Vallicoccus soli]RJK92943.1 PilZ domain-containing protein [Vallicoccus soli]
MDSTPASPSADAAVPMGGLAPGAVLVTPVSGAGASVAGELDAYSSGPAGLAVQLRAVLPQDVVESLDGLRVWVTAHTDGQLVAFQAVARRAGRTSVDLAGVTVPVQEHRRGSVRASTTLPAALRLTEAGDPPPRVSARTVDLSRASCRVQLEGVDAAGMPVVGDLVDVEIDLDGRSTVARSRVLRVDPRSAQAVLQFTALDPEDAARIERHVLRLVTP